MNAQYDIIEFDNLCATVERLPKCLGLGDPVRHVEVIALDPAGAQDVRRMRSIRETLPAHRLEAHRVTFTDGVNREHRWKITATFVV